MKKRVLKSEKRLVYKNLKLIHEFIEAMFLIVGFFKVGEIGKYIILIYFLVKIYKKRVD